MKRCQLSKILLRVWFIIVIFGLIPRTLQAQTDDSSEDEPMTVTRALIELARLPNDAEYSREAERILGQLLDLPSDTIIGDLRQHSGSIEALQTIDDSNRDYSNRYRVGLGSLYVRLALYWPDGDLSGIGEYATTAVIKQLYDLVLDGVDSADKLVDCQDEFIRALRLLVPLSQSHFGANDRLKDLRLAAERTVSDVFSDAILDEAMIDTELKPEHAYYLLAMMMFRFATTTRSDYLSDHAFIDVLERLEAIHGARDEGRLEAIFAQSTGVDFDAHGAALLRMQLNSETILGNLDDNVINEEARDEHFRMASRIEALALVSIELLFRYGDLEGRAKGVDLGQRAGGADHDAVTALHLSYQLALAGKELSPDSASSHRDALLFVARQQGKSVRDTFLRNLDRVHRLHAMFPASDEVKWIMPHEEEDLITTLSDTDLIGKLPSLAETGYEEASKQVENYLRALYWAFYKAGGGGDTYKPIEEVPLDRLQASLNLMFSKNILLNKLRTHYMTHDAEGVRYALALLNLALIHPDIAEETRALALELALILDHDEVFASILNIHRHESSVVAELIVLAHNLCREVLEAGPSIGVKVGDLNVLTAVLHFPNFARFFFAREIEDVLGSGSGVSQAHITSALAVIAYGLQSGNAATEKRAKKLANRVLKPMEPRCRLRRLLYSQHPTGWLYYLYLVFTGFYYNDQYLEHLQGRHVADFVEKARNSLHLLFLPSYFVQKPTVTDMDLKVGRQRMLARTGLIIRQGAGEKGVMGTELIPAFDNPDNVELAHSLYGSVQTMLMWLRLVVQTETDIDRIEELREEVANSRALLPAPKSARQDRGLAAKRGSSGPTAGYVDIGSYMALPVVAVSKFCSFMCQLGLQLVNGLGRENGSLVRNADLEPRQSTVKLGEQVGQFFQLMLREVGSLANSSEIPAEYVTWFETTAMFIGTEVLRVESAAAFFRSTGLDRSPEGQLGFFEYLVANTSEDHIEYEQLSRHLARLRTSGGHRHTLTDATDARMAFYELAMFVRDNVGSAYQPGDHSSISSRAAALNRELRSVPRLNVFRFIAPATGDLIHVSPIQAWSPAKGMVPLSAR